MRNHRLTTLHPTRVHYWSFHPVETNVFRVLSWLYKRAKPYLTMWTFQAEAAITHITGWIFWLVPPPLNFLSTKSLYNLWHLEKFLASLHGIWDSAKFRGDQSPCRSLGNTSSMTTFELCMNFWIRGVILNFGRTYDLWMKFWNMDELLK